MKLSNKVLYLILFFAVFMPFSYSNWGLTESSEARYAEISKEMYETGDFLVPQLMGLPHLHKPPITYYITTMGYAIFGVNEYGARFFLHIALFLQVVFVFWIAMLLYKEQGIAIISALLYFSFPIVQIAAKNLTTDVFLTTFIFASIFFYLKFRAKKKIGFLYLFYLLAGIAFLTKGPVAVLPIFIFAICYKIIQSEKLRFGVHDILGILLFIIISASWFTGLFIKDPSLYTYFTQHQLVDRVKGNSFNRQAPFWYYIALMPLIALPAFIYFVDWLIQYFRKKTTQVESAKLLLIPLAIMFIIFSTSSSKLVLYILPLYLFIALGAAQHLTQMRLQKLKIYRHISFWFGMLLLTGITVACFLKTDFNFPLRHILPAVLLGMCLLWWANTKLKNDAFSLAIINALVMAILIFIIPLIMKANENGINSTKEMTVFINKQNKSGVNQVVVYDELLPSLAFYIPNPIKTLHVQNYKSLREQFYLKGNVSQERFGYSDEAEHLERLRSQITPKNILVVYSQKNPIPDSLKILLPEKGIVNFGKKWQMIH